MSQHKLKMCREDNAGYGGKCITQNDIDILYIEVQMSISFQCNKLYSNY